TRSWHSKSKYLRHGRSGRLSSSDNTALTKVCTGGIHLSNHNEPESPHKVSLDHALAGEASAREDAVIGLSCHAGVVRFISEDCGLFASHVKNLTNSALR